MLTDIFAHRYQKRVIWQQFTEVEARLLHQCFRIVYEQVMPYWTDTGQENKHNKPKWKAVHDRLSMELGVDSLSPAIFLQDDGKAHFWSVDHVCKVFVCAQEVFWCPAAKPMV
jgi:hypothetical protein